MHLLVVCMHCVTKMGQTLLWPLTKRSIIASRVVLFLQGCAVHWSSNQALVTATSKQLFCGHSLLGVEDSAMHTSFTRTARHK